MKRFIAAAGSGLIFLCAALSAHAEPRDSVERGQRLDTDAIRDDVRTNRLKTPASPLTVEQPRQPQGQTLHRRGRPRTHALPRPPSERQLRLRQQQKSVQ
jgi:hypothetical protein